MEHGSGGAPDGRRDGVRLDVVTRGEAGDRPALLVVRQIPEEYLRDDARHEPALRVPRGALARGGDRRTGAHFRRDWLTTKNKCWGGRSPPRTSQGGATQDPAEEVLDCAVLSSWE